jgi:hypothetical protein
MEKRLASAILLLNAHGRPDVGDLVEQILADRSCTFYATRTFIVGNGVGEPVEADHGVADHLRHLRLLRA